MKVSELCCLQVEKFNILLECLQPYTYPILYPKCIGSGIQNTVNQINFYLSSINVWRHGFHNDVLAYMLQFG